MYNKIEKVGILIREIVSNMFGTSSITAVDMNVAASTESLRSETFTKTLTLNMLPNKEPFPKKSVEFVSGPVVTVVIKSPIGFTLMYVTPLADVLSIAKERSEKPPRKSTKENTGVTKDDMMRMFSRGLRNMTCCKRQVSRISSCKGSFFPTPISVRFFTATLSSSVASSFIPRSKE